MVAEGPEFFSAFESLLKGIQDKGYSCPVSITGPLMVAVQIGGLSKFSKLMGKKEPYDNQDGALEGILESNGFVHCGTTEVLNEELSFSHNYRYRPLKEREAHQRALAEIEARAP